MNPNKTHTPTCFFLRCCCRPVCTASTCASLSIFKGMSSFLYRKLSHLAHSQITCRLKSWQTIIQNFTSGFKFLPGQITLIALEAKSISYHFYDTVHQHLPYGKGLSRSEFWNWLWKSTKLNPVFTWYTSVKGNKTVHGLPSNSLWASWVSIQAAENKREYVTVSNKKTPHQDHLWRH